MHINVVKNKFDDLRSQFNDIDIMDDGPLDDERYINSRLKILWILKQDTYDSGALDRSYKERVIENIECKKLSGAMTWRRMAYVSYGLLEKAREFDAFPDANTCGESLLATAIIEIDKELGGSRTPNYSLTQSYPRYTELIKLQIQEYRPDIVIICLPDALTEIVHSVYELCHNTPYDRGPGNVIDGGAEVAVGKFTNPVFLWAYHPEAKKGKDNQGIRDKNYTQSILSAYDLAIAYSKN